MNMRRKRTMEAFCRTRRSCSVSPAERLVHRRPQPCEAPAPVPLAYKEIKDWKVAEPNDRLVRGKWWGLFHDRT